MELIESRYTGPDHLLGFTPAIRMCVKGLLLGSVVSVILPAEEDLFDGAYVASSSKISSIATSTFCLIVHNLDGEQNIGVSLLISVIISSILNFPYISEQTLRVVKQIATVAVKIVFLVNIVIMLVKEGGLIPIVALTSYLVTSIVQDANIVPTNVSDVCYTIIYSPLFITVCKFLIYTGGLQKIHGAIIVVHIHYICYLDQYGTEEQKWRYYYQ